MSKKLLCFPFHIKRKLIIKTSNLAFMLRVLTAYQYCTRFLYQDTEDILFLRVIYSNKFKCAMIQKRFYE